tara:strand:+ start:957 stop:1184 length:228 start_codon:yes stop_codon:yes gene_type:complete
MGSIFKAPKMPPPPPIQAPPEPDFSAEDEARKLQAEEDEKRRNLNRKGRRSTILTGTGLTEIEDKDIQKKTLLGG